MPDTEAQSIFYTLPETGTAYAHDVAALRVHFVWQVCDCRDT